jgi:uncharacterized protein (TIGR04222 family)
MVAAPQARKDEPSLITIMTMNANPATLGFTWNVFDWYGPEFLVFYAVCLIIAVLWCRRLHERVMKRFEVPGTPVLDDPYEIAYLSAGAPRVAQLAVVRLIASGKVEWVKKIFSTRLMLKGDPSQSGLKRAEAAVLDAIRKRGEKGLRASEAGQHVNAVIPALEARLAKLGLRPTASEKASAGIMKTWPLSLLLIFGAIKLMIGLSRDKPVWFLVVGLILTLILIFVMARTGGHLTPAGADLLGRLRLQHRDRRSLRVESPAQDLGGVSLGMALFGASTLASVAGMESLHKDLHRQMGHTGSDGGGGGSGGCGTSGCSSGCGGGGCGGCGGGGD